MVPCIIPARGGSKGIRRKNLVQLGGKPLIAWTIEQALRATLVDEVIVATDSPEIAGVAHYLGATVFMRSEESASDTAQSEVVLQEVLRACYPQGTDAVVFLQATSPIRQPRDIDNALQLLINEELDSVFSARVVTGYTWCQGQRVLSPFYSRRVPRQAQSLQTLEENGSIYVFRERVIWSQGTRIGGKKKAYIMHPLDSYQIDEPEDIELLESLLEVRLGHRHATAA